MSDLNLVVIRMWAAAAWADGQVASKERQVLQRLIDDADVSDDERAVARGYLKNRVDLDDARSDALSSGEREGIFRMACKLSAIDGHIADEERAFLKRLAGVVEIDDAVASKIQDSLGI